MGFLGLVIVCRCWLAELRSFVRRLVLVVCVGERVLKFNGCDLDVRLCNWLDVLAEFVVCVNFVMICFAALSMWVGVVLVEDTIYVRRLVTF